MLNSFLHDVAQKYRARLSLKNKKDSFAKRAVTLFLVIGKMKRKAKNIRLKMCPEKLKNFIRRWIVRWRRILTRSNYE